MSKVISYAVLCTTVLVFSGTARANIIAGYDSGVAAAPGSAGAANPLVQGWAVFTGSHVWAQAYDSGNGGWRTVDATSSRWSFYQHALSAAELADMSGGWTLTATLSMDSDAIQSGGTIADNYYLPPNHARQNDISLLIENTVAGYLYNIRPQIDANSNLFAFDGTNTYQLTTDGSAYDNFKTLQLTYDGVGATLWYDGNSFPVATDGAAATDQLIFGAATAAGTGSAIWNKYVLTPEPSSLGLLGIGLLLVANRRR